MSQLPVPAHVSEARTFARQWFEKFRDRDVFGNVPGLATGAPTLHPDAGEIFARQCLKLKAMSGALGALWVIELARAGWDEADLALRELGQELMHRKQCPVMIEAYVIEVVPKPYRRKQGRRKSRNALQDIMFVVLMDELVRRFSLSPTRNTKAQFHHSACDIVAVVVNEAKWLKRSVDYKAVEAMWLRWSGGLKPQPS